MDTGAEFNTVSSILVKKYKLNMIDALIGNGLTNIATQLTACGAIKGSECIPITKLIKLKITHVGTFIPTYEESFYVGEFEEDIIIGLPTLKRFNILLGYPDIFFSLPTAVLTQLNGELSANSKAQIEPTGLVGSGQKRKVSDHRQRLMVLLKTFSHYVVIYVRAIKPLVMKSMMQINTSQAVITLMQTIK